MNRRQKAAILACVFLITFTMAACGRAKGNEPAADRPENGVQTGGSTNSGMTADELLDLFINGSISAVDSADLTSAFYITDLDMDSGEWDSYSVGEKTDLDNDGENELILCGPYGGIYLDARDNRVYAFAAGEGTAHMLSYVVYQGAVWVMYSNRMNAGYESYHMEKYEGADSLAAEMNFGEEPVDENHIESGMKYTLNGAEISYDEYYELGSGIFAAEVNTNTPMQEQGVEPDVPDSPAPGREAMLAAYRSVLEDICYNQKFPDGEDYGYNASMPEDANHFAVFDVDQDGQEELVISYTRTPSSSGMVEFVLGYDEAAGTVRVELSQYPMLTYYDNGVIQAGWSHNQGRAGESLWPYTFWRYDADAGVYTAAEAVDAWDKSLVEEGFPDSADQDGDGVVYYVMPDGSYETDRPIDGAAYRQWRDSYVGGAQPLQMPFMVLNPENIQTIG